MKYHQKPDALTPLIRELYKAAQVDFLEPPDGFGCDFITFGPFRFIEVKSLKDAKRFTAAERRLRQLAEKHGIPYLVPITLEDAARAAGIETEA